jgi:hypothetical protein
MKKSSAPASRTARGARRASEGQTRHEQQRAIVRCAERLVGDLDAVAGGKGGLHPSTLSDPTAQAPAVNRCGRLPGQMV